MYGASVQLCRAVVLKSASSAISADGRYLQAAASVCALCGEMKDKRCTLGVSLHALCPAIPDSARCCK